ncbi:MAG TPA: hypothetical protein DIT04_13175 [Dysgonomonas sp.]|nr:hypothetical protein [Dysgonomonas sp.]
MTILTVLIILFAALAGFYAYYGGFDEIPVRVEKQGGETIVFEKVTGDYSQTPLYTDKIYNSLLNEDNLETTRGFGIFYDNPKDVETEKLRSEAGCIIDVELDSLQQARLTEKYNLKTLPESNYIIAEFPYKGSVSIMVGIFKVYPILEKYAEQNGLTAAGPVTEIYDVPGMKIVYRQEIK